MYFEKLSKGFKTLDMTSEGLGKMFKGDSADTCGKHFSLSRGSRVRRPKSEDQHQLERKFRSMKWVTNFQLWSVFHPTVKERQKILLM